MKRILVSILSVVLLAVGTAGCLHDEPQPCSFSLNDLAFVGDCSVNLDGLRDHFDD